MDNLPWKNGVYCCIKAIGYTSVPHGISDAEKTIKFWHFYLGFKIFSCIWNWGLNKFCSNPTKSSYIREIKFFLYFLYTSLKVHGFTLIFHVFFKWNLCPKGDLKSLYVFFNVACTGGICNFSYISEFEFCHRFFAVHKLDSYVQYCTESKN